MRKDFEEFRDRVVRGEEEDSERSAAVQREMEKIERRRQRRQERKEKQGELPMQEPQPVKKAPEIRVGSKVKLLGQEMPGEVRSLKGKKAQVAFGQILTTVDVAQLVVVSNNEYREATRPTAPRTVVAVDISARKLNFKDYIDVRGMRVMEALEQVQDLVDDALMVGVGSVTILHGKGTGALKEEIRRYLRTIPEVASAVDEHADRGGAGITVVNFNS